MKKFLFTLMVLFFFAGSPCLSYQEAYFAEGSEASDALEIYDIFNTLGYLRPCLQNFAENYEKGYYYCVCTCNDKNAISVIRKTNSILSKHPNWNNRAVNVQFGSSTRVINSAAYYRIINATRPCLNK
ncbi:hypothetical protein IKE67_03900 [bacterium]|nr:hypothetical protein [bacterium]